MVSDTGTRQAYAHRRYGVTTEFSTRTVLVGVLHNIVVNVVDAGGTTRELYRQHHDGVETIVQWCTTRVGNSFKGGRVNNIATGVFMTMTH